MYEDLKIIHYPDPRLKKVSTEVTAFDDNLRALTDRLFILMREHKGVGLAAPQVGLNWRVFVMNPTAHDVAAKVALRGARVLHDLLVSEREAEGSSVTARIARHVGAFEIVVPSRTVRMFAVEA